MRLPVSLGGLACGEWYLACVQVLSKTHAYCETVSQATLCVLYLETHEILLAFSSSVQDIGDNVRAYRMQSSSKIRDPITDGV